MPTTKEHVAARPAAAPRSAFLAFTDITTRWMDNDVYGHLNNVVYYSFFDTAINQFLINGKWLDSKNSTVVGFVVETGCQYISPIAFPDRVTAGIRVVHLGRSSVRYEVGIFCNEQETASAQGHFVHVYVERGSNRPVTSLPQRLREVLQPLLFGDPGGSIRPPWPST